MWRVVSPLLLLALVVLHVPTQAQALLFLDLLPIDLRPLAASEPVLLLLTGLALLGLARAPARRRPARRAPAAPEAARADAPSCSVRRVA